ncbi:hypothetical protein [Gloeothece verrucosa]|uniref:Uncharacterized protein n=1 Tax=Gloeothece verrucosa (strain PCC 7822) TaxID=497965 RepID=E0UF52_GLOV7|nr:hypothetical protein [Gloeothece verrucosa]ADN14304.1 conserved hypothetical protein [Gloeothece verrucosa PCC 7822]
MFKYAGIFGIGGSLVLGIPLMALSASAQEVITSPVCPRLYYEAPWATLLTPPAGCPANDTNLSGTSRIEYVKPVESGTQATPPLPEDTTPAVASVIPKQGYVNIQLNNTTNTVVTYEVIGHTNQRQLLGRQNIELQDIPLPVTITLVRPDNGFLKIIPVSSESDLLNITLQENPNFNDTQGVVRIQKNGQVYLN